MSDRVGMRRAHLPHRLASGTPAMLPGPAVRRRTCGKGMLKKRSDGQWLLGKTGTITRWQGNTHESGSEGPFQTAVAAKIISECCPGCGCSRVRVCVCTSVCVCVRVLLCLSGCRWLSPWHEARPPGCRRTCAEEALLAFTLQPVLQSTLFSDGAGGGGEAWEAFKNKLRAARRPQK